jgi:type I restriction enzyme S subunit
MKDSGVPWLGEVPKAWNVLRGRQLFEIKKRIAGELGPPVLSVTQAGLRVKDVSSNEGQVSLDYSKYQIVQPGEFVMNSMDLLTGGIGIADAAGVTSPDYRVFVIRDSGQCEDRYALYVLRMLYANRGFYAWGQGSAQLGRWRLPRKRFNEFPFPVPPLSEQVAIVRFLDHADRRIRRYIGAKQKLIKLLEEQKQAIIHRTVSRGLDPNVRLKPSGVDWLGDVPQHWDVLTLGRVITRAVDGPHHSPNYVDNGIPFLSARNIKVDRWSLDDAKFISDEDYAAFSKRITPEIGDVLYTKGGTTGIARAVDLRFPFQVWVHVAVLKLKPKVIPRYLALVLNSPRSYEQAQLFTRGATNQDLGLGRMKGIWFALPPLTEQEKLLVYLENETQDLVAAIHHVQRELQLLREYRTRLIADVVTGKLDVRAAAASLTDEPDEGEPLDEIEAEGEPDADDTGEALEEAAA